MPYLMAAAIHAAGPLGAYAVAPLSFAFLILLAYEIARSAAGNAAGLTAALVVAIDPVAILNAVWGLSDLPASACWIAAWFFGQRRSIAGVVVAGLCSAMGTTIRPVLGPLAVVVGAQCLLAGRPLLRPASWAWGPAAAFVAVAAAGPILVAWSQYELYGSPWQSGYPGADSFFSVANMRANVLTYPSLYLETHGPWVAIAGVGSAVAFVRSASTIGRLVRTGVPLALANVAMYLFYLPFDSWPFLRFVLPATTVLSVLAAAGAVELLSAAARRMPRVPVRLVLTALALSPVLFARDAYAIAAGESFSHAKIPAMGNYLDVVLPPNAVVVGYIQSGAVAHYTGRLTLVPGGLSGSMLDTLVASPDTLGLHPVLVLDENAEGRAFKQLFADSRFGALDWPARAEFVSDSRILFLDFADRATYLSGERWPVDVVRVAPSRWDRYWLNRRGSPGS